MAETINGVIKPDLIHHRGTRRSFEVVEYAPLQWVENFNNRPLLGPIANVTPAQAKANCPAALETELVAAWAMYTSLW